MFHALFFMQEMKSRVISTHIPYNLKILFPKKMFFIYSLTWCLFQIINSSPSCSLIASPYYPEFHRLVYFQFSQWTDLFNYLHFENCSKNMTVQAIFLVPASSSSLVLTSQVLPMIKANMNISAVSQVSIFRLIGINVSKNRTQESAFDSILNLDRSIIKFFVRGKSQSELECSSDLISQNEEPIFNDFKKVLFDDNLKYEDRPVCPFIFKRSNFESLFLNSQINHFTVKNLLTFRTSKSNTSSINSSIIKFSIEGYNYDLNERALSPLVFERVRVISILNSIGSIQADLFKSFRFLYKISVRHNNLRNFFHKIGIDWTLALNDYTNVKFKPFVWNLQYELYTYPDEDFCIFSRWPHHKLVLPIFDSDKITECTCTIKWSIQKYDLFGENGFTKNSLLVYKLCKYSDNLNLTECGKRVELCEGVTGSSDISIEFNDIKYFVYLVQDVLAFVCIPCACFLGLVLNIRVIRTIKQNEKSDLKEGFYKYMSVNSKFNCVYCLIFSLYPINVCNQFKSDYFCSLIANTLSAQYYKIGFVSFLGESIKMCSNITYILITINRYMLIGNEHLSALESISKFELKRVVYFSLFISLVLNIGHVFQYENNRLDSNFNSHYDTTSPDITYPVLNKESSFFPIYSILYFVLNYLLVIILNTLVEVIIVIKLHKELQEKRKRAEQRSNQIDARTRRNLEMDHKKEQRAIIMVVVNGLVNFLLRLPEIFIFLTTGDLIFTTDFNDIEFYIAKFNSFDSLFVDVSYLTFILTFTTNVLIYYLFNTKFKQAFKVFSNVKKK
jgi:hypothetical protein